MAFVPSFTPQADAACFHCEHIFNSGFCFPGFPGRTGCADGDGFCSLSGAFCDRIVVIG